MITEIGKSKTKLFSFNENERQLLRETIAKDYKVEADQIKTARDLRVRSEARVIVTRQAMEAFKKEVCAAHVPSI